MLSKGGPTLKKNYTTVQQKTLLDGGGGLKGHSMGRGACCIVCKKQVIIF